MNLKRFLPIKQWPSKKQWRQILTVLNEKEKFLLIILLFAFFASGISLLSLFYYKNTEIRPAVGGSYIEGMVVSPRFINPIYAASNDTDRTITEVMFSGLMKYNDKGKIISDIAKSIDIKENGTVYEVNLKTNVVWHDGKPLTADDVIFTIKTIQNPDYKSPLRGSYLGVEVEKNSDYQINFKLKNAYSGFLERLTFKILPKHIWEDISPQNFLLTKYNLQPIGSGPYQFKNIEQDGLGSILGLDLIRFKNYYSDTNPQQPYISNISFKFFNNAQDLIKAAKGGKIDGFSLPSPEYLNDIKNNFQEISLSLPRYFAIFFNQDKSNLLADENIRKALNYATNKEEIINEVLGGRAKAVNSPILPEIYGINESSNYYEFNPSLAESLLTEAGLQKQDNQWVKVNQGSQTNFKNRLQEGSQSAEVTNLQICLAKDPEIYPEGKTTGYFGSQTKEAVIKFQEKYSDEVLKPSGYTKGTGTVGTNTIKKLNEICSEPATQTSLELSLITVEDPILEKVAAQIQKQWSEIGIEIDIQTYPISQLEQDVIKTRNYQMLLFGEVLGAIPDPFPFWHSSQIKDPGLNLAKYENSAVDKLLENARTILDNQERMQQYQKFQDIVIEQAPVIFLYTPEYIYMSSNKVKNINKEIIFDPSQRFSNIENWYIKTKRKIK